MLSGTVSSSYESDDWKLHEEGGSQSVEIYQAFSPPFNKTPQVSVALCEVDAPAGPLRARVSAVDVNWDGFSVKIETWADSRLYGAAAAWIAFEG